MTENEVVSKVQALMKGESSIEVDIGSPEVKAIIEDIHKARVRHALIKVGLVVDFPQAGKTGLRISQFEASSHRSNASSATPSTPINRVPVVQKAQHTYIPPPMADDLVRVIEDSASLVSWLSGPTGSGKSTLVKYVCGKLGRKLFQINCRGDMGSEIFFGEKSVVVDKDSKQNMIVFIKGLVEQSMVEGLDESGNEVGQAAILFIDEAASMPPHVAIGINRLLESDDPRRTLVIAEDGGRVVRSHSKFRVILAANTVGRGATCSEDAAYTAQSDALDISLLNRVSATFRMGYHREIEKRILIEKIGDDKVVALVLKYRDAIRGFCKQGKLSTPFSTRRLIDIANLYRIFGDIGKATYLAVFEHLLPEERATYNETAVANFGTDLMSKYATKGIDF
jgi:cobaltochelatase CobS